MPPARGKPRPKAYLSIGEYLRKAGAFKTVNVYYNDIISTHPSVASSANGDDEEVDELTLGMIDAAQHGHLETLRFLAGQAQTGGEEGGLGTCIGERASCLMLHLAAEHGHDAIVHYLVEDLWVDVDSATTRNMTALHYASKANRTAVVRELARLGADLESRNDAGQVPAQMTKDRLLQRLFQQYLGGMPWGGATPLVDRFVTRSDTRMVDYVAVMTVKLAPQLMTQSDDLSDVKQATVSEIWRYPTEDHEDTPMTDPANLAEICTQTCKDVGGPLPPYGTLLTDTSGARSHVWSKVLGVYQDAAQRGRARIHTALGPPSEDKAVTAGEVSARVVLVLSRNPYTAAFASICDHVGELILEEAPKWGSLADWSLDMEHKRNSRIKFCLEHYATELPRPTSREAKHEVLGRVLRYGDGHSSHSSFPHLEESDLRCLTSRLGPDTILAALSCLLQEQSVLILSDQVQDLAPAASALMGLMFPLRWPHTLIPVLPVSLVHYLEAPVPFLMGMHQQELDRVGADLSCITIVNLTTNKVIMPIRPITSVSTVVGVDATGKEPQRRPSRRDSGSRSLADLPLGLKNVTERRLRRCVPLESAPLSDRVHHTPRSSSLYTPGLRVAVADLMVELFGPYQTYRYVAGAQQRMISEAPKDHRKLLEAIFSSQSWRIFLEDLLTDEGGVSGESWEEQAQLFCACVERAQHQGAAPLAAGESHSCQDVLYPSEDVEEQLALLSVYPEPDVILEQDPADEASSNLVGVPSGSPMRPKSQTVEPQERSPSRSQNGDPLNFQEKADEVLQSITTSLATVTDMFGRKDKDETTAAPNVDGPPPAPSGSVSNNGNDEGRGGGGGWDLFKGSTMADMKRRLEDIKISGMDLSPTRMPKSTAAQSDRTGSNVKDRSVSPTPRRTTQEGGLAAFGDGWRDLRRRSTEAVNEAVTKLKSALDDSDDERERSRPTPVEARQGKACGAATAGNGAEDDSFWKPFGGDAGIDASEEPVPLPSVREVKGRGDGRGETPTRAQADLFAYYGGGGP